MKKNYFIVLMTILLICFTGCATTNTISTSSAKKALKKGDWGTPTTHTLLYGLAENNVQLSSTLLQQNPNIGLSETERTASLSLARMSLCGIQAPPLSV